MALLKCTEILSVTVHETSVRVLLCVSVIPKEGKSKRKRKASLNCLPKGEIACYSYQKFMTMNIFIIKL
jgi:hypothetical protein